MVTVGDDIDTMAATGRAVRVIFSRALIFTAVVVAAAQEQTTIIWTALRPLRHY
jgi:hypothetical protein